MERAALAVILAVEFGIVLRALEIGQHVGIGPAGVAERGPLVVIAAVAADIDHRIDRGRAAEALAARLIADPAVEAGLRHGIERPVVDLAGDHQDHRARRRHHPIVVLAAGLEQRHRRCRILRQPARHRAAAGAAAHHHEIECIRHAHPPSSLSFRYAPHCAQAPESIDRHRKYGFRARADAPRNDEYYYDMNRSIFSSRAILAP